MKNQFVICTLQEKFTIFPSKLGPYSINIKLQLIFQLIKFNYAKCTTFPLLLTRRRIKSKHFFTFIKNYMPVIHFKFPLHMSITTSS